MSTLKGIIYMLGIWILVVQKARLDTITSRSSNPKAVLDYKHLQLISYYYT